MEPDWRALEFSSEELKGDTELVQAAQGHQSTVGGG